MWALQGSSAASPCGEALCCNKAQQALFPRPSAPELMQQALSRSLLPLQGLTVLQRGTWCASL